MKAYSMSKNTLNQETKSDTTVNERIVKEFSILIKLSELKDKKIEILKNQKSLDSTLIISLNKIIIQGAEEYNYSLKSERELNQELSDKIVNNSIKFDKVLRRSRKVIISQSVGIAALITIFLIK